MKGIGNLLPLTNGTPEYNSDADIELMELSHYFRTTMETIPADIPYIYVNPAFSNNYGYLNIGIVLKAGDWN